MWLTFPKDITISEDSLQCGNQKVSYDEIKSIRVYIEQTTTNLTSWTGIPTVSDLKSEISLLLIDGNRIDIHKYFFKNKSRSYIQKATVKKSLDLILRVLK